jgi:hypothetical protein
MPAEYFGVDLNVIMRKWSASAAGMDHWPVMLAEGVNVNEMS